MCGKYATHLREGTYGSIRDMGKGADDIAAARAALARNLTALMSVSASMPTTTAVEAASKRHGLKIGKSSVDRAKKGQTPLNMDHIAILAALFEVEAWQLLCPNLGHGLHTFGRAGDQTQAHQVSIPRRALEILLASPPPAPSATLKVAHAQSAPVASKTAPWAGQTGVSGGIPEPGAAETQRRKRNNDDSST